MDSGTLGGTLGGGTRSGDTLGGGVAVAGGRLAVGDFAALAAVLAAALRVAGLPAGPDRSERLARALTVMRATTIGQLHACALATMVSGPAQIDIFERVFNELFVADALFPGPSGPEVTAPEQNMVVESAERADREEGQEDAAESAGGDELPSGLRGLDEALASESATEAPSEAAEETDSGEGRPVVRRVASMTERLRERDFAQLSPGELAKLATLMRELVIAVPPRRTRRYQARKEGARLDMRRTMRQATRTGGEPLRIARRAVRSRARRLVVLCDISGSMEPYARAILQLMYVASRSSPDAGGAFPGRGRGAAGRPRTEVFTFATRLTRLTPFLAAATPETMLARAGEAAPDWAGGTRIGAALREFNERYGARGMGRGAVVLVISDGWETGDPALLGAQMARLHRIAYRVVWANPRTQSERYRPEVGGMAAAWPYCDAVVSAHNFEALDELLEALRAPRVHRPSIPQPTGSAGAVDSGAAGMASTGGAASQAADGTGAGAVQPPPLSLPITQNLGRRWAPWRS